tara:strand:- start:116 stop:319 length:204 start_codon:yes stop_codon:yes gene_type:complete
MSISASTIGKSSDTCTVSSRRERAKALVARLRHQQLLSALSGRVIESAVYAQRALRVRQAVCPCCAT